MKIITRLAPSPTGLLHLGNAWSFLLCWLAARKTGGVVHLRIDDIDPQRSKTHFVNAIVEDLLWLGLDWDGEIIFQSQRQALYKNALGSLERKNLVYPCFCTRKELRNIASAPHLGETFLAYPGTCANIDNAERQRLIASGKHYSLRLRCGGQDVFFKDLAQGGQSFTPLEYGGDFPLRRSDGVWAYQLASAVDDAGMNINFILRGNDLLSSTARQIILAEYLHYAIPIYAHAPLLLDMEGERLAKRHASLSLASLRASGVPPERVTGFLAYLANCNPDNLGKTPAQLLEAFEIRQIPANNIQLDPAFLTLLH